MDEGVELPDLDLGSVIREPISTLDSSLLGDLGAELGAAVRPRVFSVERGDEGLVVAPRRTARPDTFTEVSAVAARATTGEAHRACNDRPSEPP